MKLKAPKKVESGTDIFSAPTKRRWWIALAGVFLILFIALAGAIGWFQVAYAGKTFPGVSIGTINVAGMTRAQILNQLKQVDETVQKDITFRASGREINVEPVTLGAADPDLAKQIIYFEWTQTADAALAVGRGNTFVVDLANQLRAATFGVAVDARYQLDRQELENVLRAEFGDLEKQPKNAQLTIENNRAEVSGEQTGQIYDYKKALDTFEKNIRRLVFAPVTLELSFKEPEIKKSQVTNAVNSINRLLALQSITVAYEQKTWEITQDELRSWFEFQKKDDVIVIGINKEKTVSFLEPIKQAIDVPARDARFELENDRVTEFESSQDGKTLNVDATYQMINDKVIAGDTDGQITLAVETAPSKVATSELNDLGIKELIGRGASNFKGSPKNRRHNISTGANKLNGILIKPNEEFSLLDALGEIDGENGYLQELVIKGSRTIPEYGGGLCQIGTTTFRAALYSGLPVTQRRNHSYRVTYYEPAGMDATIYDPAPDFKFLNDTGHHILFVTKMEGDDLIFEFYGTKDGRQAIVEPDPPRIYNVVGSGAPRYIETDELPPGEKKKIESAHPGADTYFKYTIIYPNGEKKEQEFYSHYVAWPEVWLVGKAPDAPTSSTDPIITEPTPPAN